MTPGKVVKRDTSGCAAIGVRLRCTIGDVRSHLGKTNKGFSRSPRKFTE